MKITVQASINADMDSVWEAWNTPTDILQWNAASADWHTTSSTVDLREGGTFSSRMEARDGSMGFDFAGTYSKVVPKKLIEYSMADQRQVSTEFALENGKVKVVTTFDAEGELDPEFQRQGWQSILDNFVQHVENKRK